ncbi:MAG TPA: TIGR02206 family membrane protein [Rhizomicrobium sp.]|nr:TIGR02206 family membrane protein [Rhizomicrobium sp.]
MQRFQLFETDHDVVLALTLAVPLMLSFVSRRGRHIGRDAFIRRLFATLMILAWIFWYALFVARGWLGIGNELPMNLCDWASIAAIAACLTRGLRAYELAYFWSLAGTLQGLITPDINFPFPELQFIAFMAVHAFIVAAVLYLTFGSGLRPVPASLPRVALWTLAYVGAAGLTDWLTGTNYAFLRFKPGHATLYDLLSPWPAYIPETVALGLAAILILYAPWWIADRLAARLAARRSASAPAR